MENENQENIEKMTLWGVKLFQTKENADNFIAIKNKMSQKELEGDYYDVVNPNTETANETYTGLKYLNKSDLDKVGIEFEGQGRMYNLYFEREVPTEETEESDKKYELVKADSVKTWNDSVKLRMSDVLKTKNGYPFIVLSHSVKESVFENAPNKEDFIEGMKEIGLESDLTPYNGWIQFSAFVWLFETEVEKIKSYKNRNVQWTLKYEKINDEPNKIKRVFGPTFEKDMLLEGVVKEVSEDKKTVIVEKLANWSELYEQGILALQHFASNIEYLDVEKGEKNMRMEFEIHLIHETEVSEGDEVEIFLNNNNVKKLKKAKITLQELEINQPFAETETEERRKDIPEIDVDEDEIPF